MYLNEHQLNMILQTPFFSLPMLESLVEYSIYHNRPNARVLTLRFNFIPTFDENAMIQKVINLVTNYFSMNAKLVGSINYDILLLKRDSEPKSFYIWRANTNQRNFNIQNETQIMVNYPNVYQFCSNATNVNVNNLEANFYDSNVVIDRLLTVVFTFSEFD
jgi:hypothetical protein